MHTPISILLTKFKDSILTAYPQLDDASLEVMQSTQATFGHYQCNSAMKLTKIVKENPRQIAEKIINSLNLTLDQNQPFIDKLEIAGPGFINITLADSYLSKGVEAMLDVANLNVSRPEKPQKIIIDFSSPNTAKEMHVGHLRSTIIGDSLARLFEFMGHDVLRLNHIGDWGTAFGMLISHMKEKAPSVLQGNELVTLQQLMSWYKESKKRFDEDIDFKKTSQLEVVKLQQGDVEALQAWKIICNISRIAYQQIYNILDVTIEERGESFYNPLLADVVKDLTDKGLVEISDGAKCIFLDGFYNREGEILPLMIQKSDGGYNYDTTDMAAIRQRVAVEKADRIIYVTDAGQSIHFQMIFKAAEKAGYLNKNGDLVQVDHVPFGLVLGNDGKKFRTRAGDTERLIDLLIAAVDGARKILTDRSPQMDVKEREELAEKLGIGAVKYADLSCHRTGDYVFSYDRMLRFEGNTAAFLMYAYVRVVGIKRKIGADIKKIQDHSKIQISHPSESALAMQLLQFEETLDRVSCDLLPNRLTDYLYVLAEKFNAFYRDCMVEGSPEQNSRLLLIEVVARTLKQGLSILGVKTVEKM